MNKEDEKLIADYMCWKEGELLVGYCIAPDRTAHFNLNDAGLCVKKMQRRGDDYIGFIKFAYDMAFNAGNTQFHTVTAWLYDADNFFKAMAKWLKGEKK